MIASCPYDSSILLRSLQNPQLYDHPVKTFQLLETHISWVLLTGPYVYKIKKPVNLGFVDFSTLALRRYYCGEELRLNRRLAPDLYVAVVSITGTPQSPQFNGSEPVLDYAVQMKQFPQEALLTHLLQHGTFPFSHIDALAKQIAHFHRDIAVAGPDTPFGTPDAVRRPVMANFEHLPSGAAHLIGPERINRIRNWTEQEHAARTSDFQQRKNHGFVRECHGDLHLGNMALINDHITIFDCIEFSEPLRWVDVLSEVAFTVMDLIDRGRVDLAFRLLNGYLEQTGDYEGLKVFRYYLVYRSMVRAKVAGIRLAQTNQDDRERQDLLKELKSYLELAAQFIQGSSPSLMITHGVSGSGKTMLSQRLLEELGAIRVRSDVERKRLFGLAPETRTGLRERPSLYNTEATIATYRHLHEQAKAIIKAGYPVIVDATFLQKKQRQPFRSLAQTLRVPFLILDVEAPKEILCERVRNRQGEGKDASEATISVLKEQLTHQEPLAKEEQPYSSHIDSSPPLNLKHMVSKVRERLGFRKNQSVLAQDG